MSNLFDQGAPKRSNKREVPCPFCKAPIVKVLHASGEAKAVDVNAVVFHMRTNGKVMVAPDSYAVDHEAVCAVLRAAKRGGDADELAAANEEIEKCHEAIDRLHHEVERLTAENKLLAGDPYD